MRYSASLFSSRPKPLRGLPVILGHALTIAEFHAESTLRLRVSLLNLIAWL
jgi:hypothetical protein